MYQSGDWQGKWLGRYQLMYLLGQGGMGEVWLAEDAQLRRRVAVKLLPGVLATDQGYLQDFEREARTAAMLEHPHILPVHDFGQQTVGNQVVTYIIMPHITGGSLRDRLRQFNGPLPTREALHYLRQAAQAIDYAHSQNVLHRDIKPANMFLQQGWLLLADFGIAKLLTSTTYQSRTHAGSGTPEYMAPEQAQGHGGFASDRYSFAVIAYQMFSGRVPFGGDTPYSILMKHVQEEPPSPRQSNSALPAAVEQVILQGMAKRPEDRIASCTAFVDALECGWDAGHAMQVDPEATVLAPWSKRRQVNLQKTRLTAMSGSQQAGVGAWLPNTQVPPHDVTSDTPTYPSNGSRNPYNQDAYSTPISLQGIPQLATPPQAVPVTPPLEAPKGKITRRGLLIGGGAATLAVAGGIGLYPILRSALKSGEANRAPFLPTSIPGPKKLIQGVPLLSLTGHTKAVWNAVWDPTGRYLATAGEDTYVMLWDIVGHLQKASANVQSINTPIRRWKFSDTLFDNTLCWSADGRMLAVVIVTEDNKLYLLDAFGSSNVPHIYQDASQTSATATPHQYNHISWSPRANVFATSLSSETQIELWQPNHVAGPIRALTSRRDLTSHGFTDARLEIEEVAWSFDGSLVAGMTNSNPVVVWNAATGVVKQVLKLPDRPHAPSFVLRQNLAWSPVDSNLLVVTDTDVATLWDVQRNKLLLMGKTTDPVPVVIGLSWAPNGKYLAGSYERSPRIYIWDVEMVGSNAKLGAPHPPTLSFPASGQAEHTKAVLDVAWSPGGRYIASASADTTVIVWKVDAA